MIFFLKNWTWLVPSAAALGLGLMLGFTKLQLSDLRSAVAQERLDAAKLQAEAKDKVIAKEREYAALKDQIEKDRANADAAIEAAFADNRKLLTDNQRLRVKGTCRPDRPSENPAAAGSGDAPTPGGTCELSTQTSLDLLNFARDADRVTATARACQAYAVGVSSSQ